MRRPGRESPLRGRGTIDQDERGDRGRSTAEYAVLVGGGELAGNPGGA